MTHWVLCNLPTRNKVVFGWCTSPHSPKIIVVLGVIYFHGFITSLGLVVGGL